MTTHSRLIYDNLRLGKELLYMRLEWLGEREARRRAKFLEVRNVDLPARVSRENMSHGNPQWSDLKLAKHWFEFCVYPTPECVYAPMEVLVEYFGFGACKPLPEPEFEVGSPQYSCKRQETEGKKAD